MSDHAWAREQIAAAAAGGLTAAEAERLEAHARDCPACAAALADARALDRGLGALFAAVCPGPALEDRVIRALRADRASRPLLSGWRRAVAAGVAASVGLGLTGAAVSRLAERGELPFPGAPGLEQWLGGGVAARPPAPADGLAREAAPVPSGGTTDRSYSERSEGITGAHGPPNGPVSGANGPVSSLGRDSSARTWSARPGEAAFADKDQDSKRPSGSPNAPPAVDFAWQLSSESGKFGRAQNGTQWGDSFGYTKPADLKPALPPADPNTPVLSKTPYLKDLKNTGKDDQERTAKGQPAAPRPAAPGAPPPAADPAPAAPRKVVIRSGDIEFEVESFDAAAATITRLVGGIPGAFVATVNSEKLPNGKVRGSLVARVPPEHLDALVRDVRAELGKAGELKGQRIGSRDITKQYTDLESRLRAARTMEQRLLQIIKEGKGEIKQLLEAEKELGVWRTRIEEIEGELRYYGNLVALSTLTVTLAEREIRSAATLAESERVQAGVEVEDVDRARQQALAAVDEAKGRVTKSELKQLAAGQFSATLHFAVPPDAAGPVRDRLRQLGRVARLEIDRVQRAEGGPAPRDAKVTRGDAEFLVQLYNLANVAPRETAALQVAVADVPAGYQALRDAVARAGGRMLAARLDEQDRQNVTAQLDFEVRRADEPAVRSALAAAGEVVSRAAARTPEGDNVTDAKVLYRATLVSAARLKPRETAALTVEVPDVDAAAAVFGAQVAEAQGRPVDAQVAHERSGRVTARLVYDVPLAAAPALVAKFKSAGAVRVYQLTRDPQAPDGRYATARLDVTLSGADPIVAEGGGLWPRVRRGLSYSAAALLMSVTWVVFGLCVVLPWAAAGYAGYRLLRRLFRPVPAPPSAATSHS